MPFSHVSCTNFRYISSYANIEFSVRTIFLHYLHYDGQNHCPSSSSTITRICFSKYSALYLSQASRKPIVLSEAGSSLRSRLYFSLVLVIIRIQFVNRSNDFSLPDTQHLRNIRLCGCIEDKINKGFLHISACITNTSNGELYP